MRSAIFILLLALIACRHRSGIPEDFDYGTIDKGTYTNTYFDFNIPVPGKWAVQNRDQVEQLRKLGEDSASGSNAVLREKIKTASIQTAVLLTVFKQQPGQSEGFNPSFIIVAENLGNTPVNAGKDYLAHAQEIMKESNVSYQFSPGYYSEKIGNKKFDAMDATLTGNADNTQQTYYSTISKNFALSIIISYNSAAQKGELKNIINQIRFR